MKTTQYFLPSDAAAAAGSEQDYTVIGNASLIMDADWLVFFASIKKCDSNEEIIFNIEREKIPFLFTSEQLMALIETTLSVKTRLSMIAHVGPRLVDPKAKANQFIQLFRYAEEKERVESILKMRTQVLMATASLFRPGVSILGSSATKRPAPNGTTTTTSSSSSPRPVFLGIKGLSIREKIAPGTSASSSSTKLKAILSLGGGHDRSFTEKDKVGAGTPLTPASSLAASNEGLFNDRTSGNMSCSSSISSSISSSSGSSKKYSNYSEGVTTTSGRSSSYYSTPSKAPSTTTMEEVSRTIRSRGKVASLIATFSRGGVKGSTDECDEDLRMKYPEMNSDGLNEHTEVDDDAGIAITWSDSPGIKTNKDVEKDDEKRQRHTPISLQYDHTNPTSIFACFSFWVTAR